MLHLARVKNLYRVAYQMHQT